MRTALLAVLLTLSAAAARANCLTTSGAVVLDKIRLGDPSSTWVGCINQSMDILSANVSSTATASAIAAATTTIAANLSAESASVTIATTTLFNVRASSGVNNDITRLLKPVAFPNGVTGSSASWTNGVTASSFTTTATGAGQYALALSTGAQIAHGTLTLTDFANGSSTRCVHVNADGSLTPSSADCGTGSGGGSLISTGTLAASATSFPLRNQMMFDSTFVNLTDTPTANATFITFKNMGGITSAPTRTVLTSGSGTYTPPTGVSMLRVQECAGGGGGGSSQTGSTNGSDGSISIFGTIAVSSGIHGLGATGTGFLAGATGGTGGTGGTGIFVSSSAYRWAGSDGGSSGNQSAASAAGYGGDSAFFNGGGQGGAQGASNVAGGAGKTNSGGGGGGGTNNTNGGGGSGGSGGECANITAYSPGATYPYQVGAGGAGGSGTQSGGAGAAGIIIIDEYYGTQGFAAPASTSVVVAARFTTTSSNWTEITGSSATLTTSGAPIFISWNAPMGDDAGGDVVQMAVMADGQYPSQYSASAGCASSRIGSASSTPNAPAGCQLLLSGLAAGSHTISAYLRRASGTGNAYVDCNPAQATVLGAPCRLDVFEIKNTAGTGDVSSGGSTTYAPGTAQIFPSIAKSVTPTANATYREGLAKAWVVFTGTGTVTIQDGINVASITDNGVGNWTVNFSLAFASPAYACTVSCETSNSTAVDDCNFKPGSQTTTTITILDYNSTDAVSARDANRVHLICEGRQ